MPDHNATLRVGSGTTPPTRMRANELAYSPSDHALWLRDNAGQLTKLGNGSSGGGGGGSGGTTYSVKLVTTSWVLNGVNTTFPMLDTTGAPVAPRAATDLIVSLDGVIQQASTDYSISASNIVFVAPPPADATIWAVAGLPLGSGDALSLQEYGYIGDGASHPASSRFASLAAAQAVYPSCVSLTDEIDGLALQTALNSFGYNQATLILPAGSIGRCSRALTTSGATAVSILGNWSTLVFPAGSGALVHNSAATYEAGLHIEKLALQCVGAGGTAITAAFNPASGDLVLTDMQISGYGNQTTNYWTAILAATDASLTFIDRVTGVGINSGLLSLVGNGFSFTATAGCFQISIRDSTINYYNTALAISSSTAPGLEGVVCTNFQANGCMRGVVQTSTASSYWAPQFVFQNCQWNLFQQVMSFNQASEIWISDNLIYLAPPASSTSGTSFVNQPLFYFSNCFNITITGNSFEGVLGSRNSDLITLDNSSKAVSISGHNVFHHNGAMTGVGIRLNAGVNNVKEDGTNFYLLPSGTALFQKSAGVVGTGNSLQTQVLSLGGMTDVAANITYMNTFAGTTNTSGVMAVTLPAGMFAGIVAAIVCNGAAAAVDPFHPAVLTCTTSTLTVKFLGLTSAIPARVNYMIQGY
jgi:hypothetical protein